MALLLCSITISAHDFEIDGIYYNIQYSTYYVQVTNKGKNYGGYAGSVTIPTRVTYNGVTYEVTRIGYEAFRGCSSLTSIEIPNSVTSIGREAFAGCSSLTSIEIPNSVTSIGNYAFSGCSNLDYFSFGKSVKSIGQKAFSGCVNLKKLISYAEVPPTCDTYALDDINKRECTLQIPENTLSAYQSANQWKDFYFIEDVLSEIGGVTIDENKDTRVDVYSINGQLIKRNADAKQLSKELPTGIYIINGKKVYVR